MTTGIQKTEKYQGLLEQARAAFQLSYAPYSKYRVGAALLTKDGKVIPGCNIEIVSYEGSICAERTAIASAIAQGHREFEAIAVVCEKSVGTWPCGVCRQYLAEFGIDLMVVIPGEDGSIKSLSLKELLPHYFPPSALKHLA